MKKLFSMTLALALMLGCLSGCGGSPPAKDADDAPNSENTGNTEATTTISVGTYAAANSVDGIAMEHFAEYVERESGGRLQVDVYHNNQLGDTNGQIENVIMGTQDIFLTGIDPLMQWAPAIKYCSTYYLFESDDHLLNFLNSDIMQAGYDELLENNIMILDDQWTFKQGPYRVMCSTVPFNSFEDVNGLKVRTPEVETVQKCWQAFGASTLTVSMAEIYLAAQQGMVQAFEMPASTIKANAYCEVTKYLTKTDSFPQRYALIMNQKKFESLPEDLQTVLREGTYSAGALYSEKVLADWESDLQSMIDEQGVTWVDDMDLTPFREAMSVLYEEWEASGYFEKGIIAKIKAMT